MSGLSFTLQNSFSNSSCVMSSGSSVTWHPIPMPSILFLAPRSYARSSGLAPTRTMPRHGSIPCSFNLSVFFTRRSFIAAATSAPFITMPIAFPPALTDMFQYAAVYLFFQNPGFPDQHICFLVQLLRPFSVLHQLRIDEYIQGGPIKRRLGEQDPYAYVT